MKLGFSRNEREKKDLEHIKKCRICRGEKNCWYPMQGDEGLCLSHQKAMHVRYPNEMIVSIMRESHKRDNLEKSFDEGFLSPCMVEFDKQQNVVKK